MEAAYLVARIVRKTEFQNIFVSRRSDVDECWCAHDLRGEPMFVVRPLSVIKDRGQRLEIVRIRIEPTIDMLGFDRDGVGDGTAKGIGMDVAQATDAVARDQVSSEIHIACAGGVAAGGALEAVAEDAIGDAADRFVQQLAGVAVDLRFRLTGLS